MGEYRISAVLLGFQGFLDFSTKFQSLQLNLRVYGFLEHWKSKISLSVWGLKVSRLCRWRTDICGTRGIPKGGTDITTTTTTKSGQSKEIKIELYSFMGSLEGVQTSQPQQQKYQNKPEKS